MPDGFELESVHRVEHRELAKLAALAREQVAPPVGVTFAGVRAETRRRSQLRWATRGAAAVLAAVALLWLMRPADVGVPTEPPAVARAVPQPGRSAPGASVGPETPQTAGEDPDLSVLKLAGGGFVYGPGLRASPIPDSTAGERPGANLEGTERVWIGDGEFRVETGAVAVEVAVYDRVLEIAADSVVTMAVSVDAQRFEAEAGIAQWHEGSSTALEAESRRRDVQRTPSAEALARRAETEMKASNGPAAIRTLTRLARRYPRSGAAKAALLDLARLRKAADQPDRARCAYGVFLERWPKAGAAQAVRRARDRLAGTRGCKGLEPQ